MRHWLFTVLLRIMGHMMEVHDSAHSRVPVYHPWPHRLAWALAITVFPLIWMGGTVTTYDAGMAVPDWPTTYSYWFYPVKLWLAVWDVFLEHGHRLLGQLAGVLALVLAVALWRCDERRWMRWVGVALVAGVIAQGTLGGIRVLLDDRMLARVHGCTAPLFFGLCTAVVAWTSRERWAVDSGQWAVGSISPPSAIRHPPSSNPQSLIPNPFAFSCLLTAAIYVEVVLGAQLRRPSANMGFGGGDWFEVWVWLKALNAALIVAMVVWLTIGLLRRCEERMIRVRAWWLMAITSIQIVLACATWVANYGWPEWFARWVWPLESSIVAQGRLLVLVTTAHAAVGSLTLVAALSLTLWLGTMRSRSR